MKDERQELINELTEKIQTAGFNEVVGCELKTSERVLKRVTDGIYRQPASALRELIANAYDADATLVEIQTDPPRFSQIIVRDNGNGLTTEALSYMTQSIGGSSKRTSVGVGMGVSSSDDRMCSPGGRKLIGKIGIGLFSVAQLTKEFQIITKTKGSDHRTVADIILHTYSEDATDDPDSIFKAGEVKIWKVPATDTENHGTEVILRNLLKKTTEDLTSKEMWLRCNPEKLIGMEDISVPSEPPVYHIGCVYDNLPDEIEKEAKLPWISSDSPETRFRKLVDGLYNLRGYKGKNPSIYDHLDYYFRMLWVLSLSAPLNYVDGHPFDLNNQERDLRIFCLGNYSSDQAEELSLSNGQTIRNKLGLISPERGSAIKFNVIIDGVQLLRPIKFQGLPKTLESVPYTLLFVGKANPDLSSYPVEIRGGQLEFEAYFFWNHIVVPKEHAGVLIRINDSNGVLFDDTFMHYPVSEQRRKDQVTAEIFVTRGLDPALNIDRESFNYSHPHYQYLRHWVHNSFRQFANRHKAIAKEFRETYKKEFAQIELDNFQKQMDKSLRSILPDEDIPLPAVEFIDDEKTQEEKRKRGILIFKKADLFAVRQQPQRMTQDVKLSEAKFEEQIKAVAKVLDAYGLFDKMPYDKQQSLLKEIVAIFSN